MASDKHTTSLHPGIRRALALLRSADIMRERLAVLAERGACEETKSDHAKEKAETSVPRPAQGIGEQPQTIRDEQGDQQR